LKEGNSTDELKQAKPATSQKDNIKPIKKEKKIGGKASLGGRLNTKRGSQRSKKRKCGGKGGANLKKGGK